MDADCSTKPRGVGVRVPGSTAGDCPRQEEANPGTQVKK